MTHDEFDKQISRLENQWRNTYGEERKALLWATLKNVDQRDFQLAVDTLLVTVRAAPLLNELSLACDKAQATRLHSQGQQTGFYQTLKQAESRNRTADPETVKDMLTHLRKFLDGKIDRDHFEEGCKFFAEVATKVNPDERPVVITPPRQRLIPPPKWRKQIGEKD